MGIINCDYIVVHNEDELKAAEKYFKGSKDIRYPYPFSIGKELGFLFYCQETVIEDYYCEDEDRTYKYNQIKL